MPKTSGRESEKAPASLESLSVYDFLYQDVLRVGSFLAQFEPHGLPQAVKEVYSAGSASHMSSSANAGLSIKVANAGANAGQTSSTTESESGERAYDPLWRNAISLLSYLENHGLLRREIENARLGQIILVSGKLKGIRPAYA